MGQFQSVMTKKKCQKQEYRSKSAVHLSVHKPVGLCTGECIQGQKKLVGVAMGLYTGGTIDGWAC